MCDGFNDRHQGVYANIITNDFDESYVRIYIGSAAGPYKQPLNDHRRDRGLHQRITTHGQQSIRNRSLKAHERLLQTPGIRCNWLILVSFRQKVSKALVNVTHAVMTILFRACESIPYIVCRPNHLFECPHAWGLNEIGLLGQHGLAGYNGVRHGKAKEDAILVHERNVVAGQRCQSSRRRDHNRRLENGGRMHVNVLVLDGIIKRFFITPMTKSDGGHIDITIPRVAGLAYGLQISRIVDVQFDLEPNKDHPHPYAVQASSLNLARKLGILVSGQYACGPQEGDKFNHWIQCNRPEAIIKALHLTRRIYAISDVQEPLEVEKSDETQKGTTIYDLLKSSGSTSKAIEFTLQPRNAESSSSDQATAVGSSLQITKETSYDTDTFQLCFRILSQLKHKILNSQIRAAELIRQYLQATSIKDLAQQIAEAVRPGVVPFLRMSNQFELSKKVHFFTVAACA